MAEQNKKKHRILRISVYLISAALLVLFVSAGSVYAWAVNHTDPRADAQMFSDLRSDGGMPCFYYRSGDDWLKWEGITLYDAQYKIWYDYDDLPEPLKNAFVAVEDHRFFSHDGIDWRRTAAAVINYATKRQKTFGGSTITQQLIKNMSGETEQTPARKIREGYRAVCLERRYTKEEILELYLNIVPMSGNCIGVGAAAKLYFDKEPSGLSLAECASVAAVTNSPAAYDPMRHPERHLERRNLVLSCMREYGYITEQEYEDAVAEPLCLTDKKHNAMTVNSWYIETVSTEVIRALMREYGWSEVRAKACFYHGGLSVYTSVDRQIQNTLERYFADERHFSEPGRLQYAMCIIDPMSGALLGTVGASGKKEGNWLLDHTLTPHLPGSVLKPLAVYAPAIEEKKITMATVFDDTPITLKGQLWPRNYPDVYAGLTTVSDAVRYSKNTVAVKVCNLLGVEKSYSYLTDRLGLTTLVRAADKDGRRISDLAPAPLALGQLSYGATLREITAAYTSFYDGGFSGSYSYEYVTDRGGSRLLNAAAERQSVWSNATASIMTEMLCGVVNDGTAKSITLKELVDVAGKTGTSGQDRDRWFVGYTPSLTAGIWCGCIDGTAEIGKIGHTHLEVWDRVMHEIYRLKDYETENFQRARGLISAEYCKDSGKIECEICKKDPRGNRTAIGWFTADTLPTGYCDRHIAVRYDRESGGVLFGDTADRGEETALIRVEDRDFPQQIYITDAEYVYRETAADRIVYDTKRSFFDAIIPPGHFAGISRTDHPYNAAALPRQPEAPEPPDLTVPFPWCIIPRKTKRAG